MDVLVMLEDRPEHSTVLAHVNSVPAPLNSDRRSRDVVTLYGVPTSEGLAMALAAAAELRRQPTERSGTIRHVALWPERGAIGDAAWRDPGSGDLVTRDLTIPVERLEEVAGQLLDECGSSLRRVLAGLSMPDWPEGTPRAISFSLLSTLIHPAGVGADREAFLDTYRTADGIGIDIEGD
jgi:hypothetical protein